MSSTSPLRRSTLPRFAESAVGRARLAVVPRLRSRAPRVPFVTLISLVLLGGVVGLLLFNTSMQQASFAASRLEDQATNLSARQESLAMEVDQLRDPQRLAQLACGLGMVVGPTAAFVELSTGAVTGTPIAAAAAPCAIDPPAPRPPVAAPSTEPVTKNGPRSSGVPFAEPFQLGR